MSKKFFALWLLLFVLSMIAVVLTPRPVESQTLPVPTVEVTAPQATPTLPTFVDFLGEAKRDSQSDPTLSVIVWLKSDAWFPVEEITRTGSDFVCWRTVGVRGALTAERCVMTSEIAYVSFDRPSVEPPQTPILGE